MNRTIVALALTYALVAIVTFGHAAANCEVCATPSLMASKTERQVFTGVMSAALWPLYWSWFAWAEVEVADA